MKMRKTLPILLAAAVVSGAAPAADPMTAAKLYDSQVSTIESELVPLVQAMPADKFNFAPANGEFKGVRTFAQQAKHVAAVIYIVAAAAAKQDKPPVDTGGESGPDSVKTKEQIVQFLKDSFAYAHKVTAMITSQNQLEMVKSPFGSGEVARGGVLAVIAWHSFDHYGQMVEYARMNGFIPPASK
ncbi:MAG TPA: DinB family protein [Bryobacteraceae bacterium]|nr:DinB family protein [Bryobacteraceae bacterium]